MFPRRDVVYTVVAVGPAVLLSALCWVALDLSYVSYTVPKHIRDSVIAGDEQAVVDYPQAFYTREEYLTQTCFPDMDIKSCKWMATMSL